MPTGWRMLRGAPVLLALFSISALAQTLFEVRIEGY